MKDKAIRYAKKHYPNAEDMSLNIINDIIKDDDATDYEDALMEFINYIRDNIDQTYIETNSEKRRYKDHKKHTNDFLEVSWKSDWIDANIPEPNVYLDSLPKIEKDKHANYNIIFLNMTLRAMKKWVLIKEMTHLMVWLI